jgi:hypothetical protein
LGYDYSPAYIYPNPDGPDADAQPAD